MFIWSKNSLTKTVIDELQDVYSYEVKRWVIYFFFFFFFFCFWLFFLFFGLLIQGIGIIGADTGAVNNIGISSVQGIWVVCTSVRVVGRILFVQFMRIVCADVRIVSAVSIPIVQSVRIV